jgi:nickel-dependent lactate racemase
MVALVGTDIVERYEIVQHEANGPDHVSVGEVDGVEVMLMREYVDADLRITTGFVEPHFFAGYSGGPKGVCPGLAHKDTILEAHSPERISNPHSTWLELEQNPVHAFVSKAVALCPPTLSIDVTIDAAGDLDQVFVGALPTSHQSACRYVYHHSVVQLERRFPVVVTTNAGYPLDQNLYQSVKGMASAERAVLQGGTIVMASACDDGVPRPSHFASILDEATCQDDLRFGEPGQDRWQVQILGRLLGDATVWLHARGLDDADIGAAQLRAIPDLQAGIDEALDQMGGPACVLVHGPLVVVDVVDS